MSLGLTWDRIEVHQVALNTSTLVIIQKNNHQLQISLEINKFGTPILVKGSFMLCF